MTTQDTDRTASPKETHSFQAEVSQLLHLVIHSLYSHKEIFLRELISNASDALDKLRFRAITEPEVLADDTNLEIRISADREKGTLTIEDNGVGMTHDELAKNLGTIAHSGSRAFIEQLAKKGTKDVNLIGQFGVGFYSAWLVADRVEVVSRAAGAEPQAWRWASDAKESFTLEPAERAQRGTEVVLHLKDDQKEFLDDWRVRELIKRYSDYVSHPIKMRSAKKDGGAEPAWETLNRASALWQRPKGEITDEQYNEFYGHLTHETEPPLARTHFRVEGSQEFVGLLFVPAQPPFDLQFGQQRRGVQLFVRRVFIMDNCEELLPQWLRFVRGVVDSDDLPLNVSREILQDSSVVRAIRKQVVRKTLDLLEEIAKDRTDDYTKLWQSYGAILKEGLALEFEHRERLSLLVRYASSRDGAFTSLTDYVARMPQGQEAIYYIVGESRKAVENSPYLEALKQHGYEVLFMTDAVDAWAAEGLREFQGKKLVSAMHAELKLGEAKSGADDKTSSNDGGIQPLLDRMKAVLGDHVRDVKVSERLTDSPCCLVLGAGESPAFIERLLRGEWT